MGDTSASVDLLCVEFDQLITKPKLDDGDAFEDYVAKESRFETKVLGEAALKEVKEGQVIQLERRGYFRCDVPAAGDGPMVLFEIPTGKKKSMSSEGTKVKAIKR